MSDSPYIQHEPNGRCSVIFAYKMGTEFKIQAPINMLMSLVLTISKTYFTDFIKRYEYAHMLQDLHKVDELVQAHQSVIEQ